MKFYRATAQRKRASEAPAVTPPIPIKMRFSEPGREPELPIVIVDDELPRNNSNPPFPWTSQHPAIAVAQQDIISDKGVEIYNVLVQRGIRNVFMTGVHVNKCVLSRPFGIRQLVLLGINVVLVRDLTDSLYSPAISAGVSHDRRNRARGGTHRKILVSVH